MITTFVRRPTICYKVSIESMDEDVALAKWLDNRSVVLSSNYVGVGDMDNVQRWDKGSKKKYRN